MKWPDDYRGILVDGRNGDNRLPVFVLDESEEPKLSTVTVEPILQAIPDPAPALVAPKAQAEGLVERIKITQIANQQDAQDAAILLKEIKTRAKAHEDARKLITGPMDAAKAKVMELFKPIAEMYKEAEGLLGGKLGAYDAAQRRIAEEIAAAKRAAELKAAQEEAARQEAARKQREAEAATERARIEAERQAAIAQAKTAADRKAAEEQAKLAADSAKAKEAAALEAQWDAEEAAAQALAIAEKPLEVAAPAKLAGFHTRKDWKIEVVDIQALAAAVGAGSVPPGTLEPVASAIKNLVKAGMAEIPGCKITQIDIPVAR